MPRSGWNGRKVTQAVAFVIARDGGTCWLCRHPGATSLDHVIPVSIRPDLEWNATNWKAAHLHPAGHPSGKGCDVDGCECPGNTGRKAKPHDARPTREW